MQQNNIFWSKSYISQNDLQKKYIYGKTQTHGDGL